MLNFNDIFVDDTKYGMKIPKEKYLSVGLYPVIDQSKEQIAGYTDESEGIYCDVPAIIFGDHTRIIKYIDVPFFLGADGTKLLKIKDNTAFNCKYLYYALSNAKIPNTGYNRHFKWLKELSFNIPSIEKQREIADLMDIIVNLENLRKKQLEKLELFVKSRFIEMFGDPITNTKRWPADKVEAVCSNIYGGGTPSKSKEEYWNGDIPWISSKDMKSDMISDSQIRITNLGLDNSSAKLVPINSVIMVIRSGILKHTLPVAINTVPVTVNQDLKVFIPSVSIHYRFLAFLFKMLEKDILAGVRAVTADNIEFDTLKNRKIILPPVQLQNQFASFVTQVDKSKLAIQQSLDELETLKKSLMQQYFG